MYYAHVGKKDMDRSSYSGKHCFILQVYRVSCGEVGAGLRPKLPHRDRIAARKYSNLPQAATARSLRTAMSRAKPASPHLFIESSASPPGIMPAQAYGRGFSIERRVSSDERHY